MSSRSTQQAKTWTHTYAGILDFKMSLVRQPPCKEPLIGVLSFCFEAALHATVVVSLMLRYIQVPCIREVDLRCSYSRGGSLIFKGSRDRSLRFACPRGGLVSSTLRELDLSFFPRGGSLLCDIISLLSRYCCLKRSLPFHLSLWPYCLHSVDSRKSLHVPETVSLSSKHPFAWWTPTVLHNGKAIYKTPSIWDLSESKSISRLEQDWIPKHFPVLNLCSWQDAGDLFLEALIPELWPFWMAWDNELVCLNNELHMCVGTFIAYPEANHGILFFELV